MKKKIVLFQPYLRKHILNFGKGLRNFEFKVKKPMTKGLYQAFLPSYEIEIERMKTNRVNIIRRLFGILNARIKFDQEADLFFTYGCMLFTNKPYCVYIENGVAIYNYDTVIAKHPLARLLFAFLVRRNNCKRLIFMSEAGQKSFFATVSYSQRTKTIAESKSMQIYPLIESRDIEAKKYNGELKLLFAGLFYMKGGIELVHAFSEVRKKHENVSLTIITPLHTVKKSDQEAMKSIPGLNLLDAKFTESEMNQMYQDHDIFMLPTFRDGFGLVLVEAISWGMPIICNDQYATTEVAVNNYNAFVYPNHPLKDYDPDSYRLHGRYYHPKYFYADLFRLQQEGQLKPVEEFLTQSIEKFLLDPTLLGTFSQNALNYYQEKFHEAKITRKIEEVFTEALKY